MTDSTTYRPEGFQDVTPYLVVRKGDADALITFLKRAFDAEEVMAFRDADGRVAHAQLRVGDSVIELGESAGEWLSRFSLHFYVPDVDAVHAKALAAGAKELSKPVDQEYGERSGGIEDPCGNHWYIARTLS
jgi:uncharacterized glyoxalase superfamily protein PhnB